MQLPDFLARIDPTVLSWIIFGLLVAAFFSFIACIVLFIKIRRLRQALPWGVVRQVKGVTTSSSGGALRNVSIVKFDAFSDMGGRMSFSAAILDDNGDGIVLTGLNGRSESRIYAKGVIAGQSELALSAEEEQAIAYALRSSVEEPR